MKRPNHTRPAVIREVQNDDVTALLDMMQRAHADAGFALDRELAKAAFSTLLADRRRGMGWIATRDLKPEGYVVVTWKLSMAAVRRAPRIHGSPTPRSQRKTHQQ